MILWLLSCVGNEQLYEQRRLQLLDIDADGFSVLQGDCDDQDPLVHPAADEICDGIDNDCDDQIDVDPVALKLWAFDADGDGFGGAEHQEECASPGNRYVDILGDCNDFDDSIYPQAPETWQNALTDNDCDGLLEEAAGNLDIGSREIIGVDDFVAVQGMEKIDLVAYHQGQEKLVFLTETEQYYISYGEQGIANFALSFQAKLLTRSQLGEDEVMYHSSEAELLFQEDGDIPDDGLLFVQSSVIGANRLSDWDGDGLEEVAFLLEKGDQKMIHVVENLPDGLINIEDATANLLNTGTANITGGLFDAGDINADGYTEMGIEIDGESHLYFGGEGFDISSPAVVFTTEGGLTKLHDLNGDDRADLGHYVGGDVYLFTEMYEGGTFSLLDYDYSHPLEQPVSGIHSVSSGEKNTLFIAMTQADSNRFMGYFLTETLDQPSPEIGFYSNRGLHVSNEPMLIEQQGTSRMVFWDQSKEELFFGDVPVD